jgi:hypothetical protein
MKMAPREQATAYLTGASLAINLGSGISPLVGGFLADFFSARALTFTVGWSAPSGVSTFAPIHLAGFDFLFLAAFVLGLFTMNILAAIREEGEVDRQVVLDELLGEARESFRSMSTVPALGFVSVPYNYLRRVPGMDVAVGVTAYQIASSAKSAVSAVNRGTNAARDVAEQVGNVVSYAVDQVSDVGILGEKQVTEIARHATRGAVHALDEVTQDLGNVAKGAMLGTVKALSWTTASPLRIIREIGYGAVLGAGEVGADVGQTATEAIAGAREAAYELGISQDEAAARAAEGMLAAAESIGPEAMAEVKNVLAGAGLAPGVAHPDEKPGVAPGDREPEHPGS